ncbi:LysR substrate-binding domain-containing protein [Variovorax sp. J22P168]|uniref:LysR substrate-binding domain-containing protein n=1 Tax=Variovorax jilinensis TaxID=3053513 RepID=UPI0025784182|nr:LysR substrate-binding domain-containing protein [Variovorax sp. J22P168]MDM0014353.1 LysR substrate-binding domain-containing protein [Variovorax sp. J22P168]
MIHLNLRQLEYFVAAARHGGAARAAEALSVSQPSISKAIADLEALWGELLFVRLHARGLELTGAGARRHREAHALLEQARTLAAPHSGELSGLLRVGCLSTLAPRWLPGILARMGQAHPAIEVQLVEADIETLTRMLERGALDVALIYDVGLARSVRLEPVAQLRPYALLPWGHRLAQAASLRIADLAREPLVLINLPHSREYFLSLFRDCGATPRIAHETASLEMVRALVANGLGVSLLTTRPLRDHAYDGKRIACRRLRGQLALQSVVLAYPNDPGFASPLAEPFAAVVQAGFAKESDALTR